MASGKSTIGRKLSAALEKEFIDLDALIVQRSGMEIPDIFGAYGESTFRQLETSALHQCTKRDSAVVATGGGTPCYYDNMERMKASGQTIYIKLEAEMLVQRLSAERDMRPLVADKSEKELKSYILSHLATRSSYYESADHIVDGTASPALIVDQIATLLKG